MCGINGFILNNTNQNIAVNKLEKMNDCIYHRGPDEDGFFIESVQDGAIGFAMRRLSIIDLSSGKQPIYSDDRLKIIVFNGEIYNYKILKEKLINKGKTFHTNSDTEVILKLYEEYGTESFKMLDGMFAFSIFDKGLNKIFIARDFFGEKPLYYSNSQEGVIWCSELKSLISILDKKPNISFTGLNLYFQLTYIPAPYTIYEGVKKLEANRFIEYNLSDRTFQIFNIHDEKNNERRDINFENAKNEVKNLVKESVLSRSVSDVPIGTFLSGGVDSSIVSLCLSEDRDEKINTFSIGYEKKSFDESEKSKVVAKLIGSNHHEFIISENDLSGDIDKIILNFDEPFADSSALPSYLVAKKTSDFVKVALTGDGGDEVFGGYNKYLIGKINTKYTALMPEKFHSHINSLTNILTKQKEDNRGLKFKLKKAINSIDYQGDFFYNIIRLGFKENELAEYLNPDSYSANILSYYQQKFKSPKNLSDFRKVDKIISLEGDMLVKVDRTSMLTSLECRAPFLNKNLWDYTLSLPENYLLNGNDKKFILKKAFEDKFPKGFLEKSKKGFGVPVGDWLKTSLREELLSYVDNEKLSRQGIFNIEQIVRLVKNHINSVQDNTFKVWTFFCFQKWYYQKYQTNV